MLVNSILEDRYLYDKLNKLIISTQENKINENINLKKKVASVLSQ